MRYAVIGGGVAGVCCVEELCQSVQPADEALFVSASTVLKVSVYAVLYQHLHAMCTQ